MSKNPNKTDNTLDCNITTAQLKSSTSVNIICLLFILHSINPLLSPLAIGGLFISSVFEGGGLFERGLNEFTKMGHFCVFSNIQKMLSILHKELRHKVEMLKHMMLEVVQPDIKTNPNFQHMNKPIHFNSEE